MDDNFHQINEEAFPPEKSEGFKVHKINRFRIMQNIVTLNIYVYKTWF